MDSHQGSVGASGWGALGLACRRRRCLRAAVAMAAAGGGGGGNGGVLGGADGRRGFALAHGACSNTHQISQVSQRLNDANLPVHSFAVRARISSFLSFIVSCVRLPWRAIKTNRCARSKFHFCVANTAVSCGECCLLIGDCLRRLCALQPTARAGGGCAAPVTHRPLCIV